MVMVFIAKSYILYRKLSSIKVDGKLNLSNILVKVISWSSLSDIDVTFDLHENELRSYIYFCFY